MVSLSSDSLWTDSFKSHPDDNSKQPQGILYTTFSPLAASSPIMQLGSFQIINGRLKISSFQSNAADRKTGEREESYYA